MFSGDVIGKYRLLDRLGRGGMGEVWLATASGHGGFTKTVVVKTLLPELACDPLFIDMLAHEARISAKLSHPNLIEVFDFIEHGGIYLLAMEHVVGRPLHHIMKATHARGWTIPAWFALRIAWDCCRGLECAHDEGIIHCDLSPSNVMVTFTGVTKILDFGVAHSSTRGPKADRLKGKFPYMSPERIKSRATDRRTDIYALGVMLYLLFTGELPFTADSDAALLHKIVTERPRPPSELCEIDPRVEQLILRAMQPDPGARHQTVGEVLAALSPCLDGLLGTYGQQEAAAYVKNLFDTDHAVTPRRLPAMTEPLAATTKRAAEPTGLDTGEIAELHSFDIDVESSVLEIPSVPPPPPRQPAAVFASTPAAHETRTTVQSLFCERPSLATGHTRIFDRSDHRADTTGDLAGGSEPGPPRTAVPAMPAIPPLPPAEPAPDAEPTRGGFGGYTSARPTRSPEWPWPTSRTKSQ